MTTIKVNAVIRNNNRYLLLKRSPQDGGFWQTLTGTVENDENLMTTLRREIAEEAGIADIAIEEDPIHFFTWKKHGCDVVELVYLCRTSQEQVTLSHEHTEYMWADNDRAEAIVEKPNNKVAIRRANERY